MGENLIRCQNGHMFSKKRYGTVCPFCNIETATPEKKEVQSEVDIEEALFHEDIKPVCGWIVCVSGPRQGKDYKVVSGKNFIGRADDMNIQILGDNEYFPSKSCRYRFRSKEKKRRFFCREIPMDWFI